MIKKLIYLCFSLYSINLWSGVPLITLDPSVHNTSKIPFQPHTGSSPFSNYVSLELPFKPIENVYREVGKIFSKEIKTRGEAHITVITPPEYSGILSTKLSIQEINELALKLNLQDSQFSVVCLGEASIKTTKNSKTSPSLFTYYIVVASEDLFKFRTAINKLFISKGGDPNAFNPQHFYPHITVGFTERDLHESDGVTKDKSTCKAKIVTQ